MEKKLFISPIFLSLCLATCATSPEFTVKMVDGNSRSPISDVKVTIRSTHYTGRKSMVKSEDVIGKTNFAGLIHIQKLNLYNRDHIFDFYKLGYVDLSLYVRELDGRSIYVIWRNEQDIEGPIPIPLTQLLEITVPMRRN